MLMGRRREDFWRIFHISDFEKIEENEMEEVKPSSTPSPPDTPGDAGLLASLLLVAISACGIFFLSRHKSSHLSCRKKTALSPAAGGGDREQNSLTGSRCC